MNDKSGKSIPTCFICDKEFDSETVLVIHLSSHTKKEMVKNLKKYRNNYT